MWHVNYSSTKMPEKEQILSLTPSLRQRSERLTPPGHTVWLNYRWTPKQGSLQHELPNGPEKAEHNAHSVPLRITRGYKTQAHGANWVWRDPGFGKHTPCTWEGETNRKGGKVLYLGETPKRLCSRGTLTMGRSPPQNPPSIVTKTNHEREHLRRMSPGPLRDTAVSLKTTWSL